MSGASANHFVVRPDWLASHDEPAIDPHRPVIDAHHHLYDRPGQRYLVEDYLADCADGHDIRASVYVQARAMYRTGGDAALRPVGEVEFANGLAAMSASGAYGSSRICAGIVGFADLTLGEAVRPVLERLITAAGGLAGEGGRFCGIRQTVIWDRDSSLMNAAYPTTEDIVDSRAFRDGFAQLGPLGLSFDAWAFFPQHGAIERLARAFPDTPIFLNHCGGVVRINDYAKADVHDTWRGGMSSLAQYPNVSVKLSGLGMRLSAFGFETGMRAPGSPDLAAAWRPWVMHCLEAFGPQRCMWGSNFPVDKGSYSLKVGLNAYKRLFSDLTEAENDELFALTAQRLYRLQSGPGTQPGARRSFATSAE